ncbi:MAG: DPP IV N-terminal domain-containing protein [Bacteroidales bacterium]|nr:DPP IV N-terminal domain-containing protein [Bacteroidales bacterium]MCF8387033.1 DPP IV N-terminal domain-containing protein [Bacteroidales bacterium]MCF8398750.1 DPP IV N-terminal domain-containing protein [Bacteroidales bacterium]
MIRKFILSSIVLLMTGFLVNAQEKQLSLQEAAYMSRDVFPDRLSQIQWMGDSDRFAYVQNNKVVTGRATSEKRDTLFGVDELNAGLSKLELDSIKRMPRISFVGEKLVMFTSGHKLFLYDFAEKELRKMNEYPKAAENVDINKKTFQIAYTIDNNLYVALEGKQLQVTDEEDKGILSGHTVHRVEFGISKGTFWSPDGSKLAFYRKDESMVTEYPIVDITKRIAELAPTRYPMAGMTSEEVTLGIYDIESEQTTFVKTGEPADQYLTTVTWGPDGNEIYIAVLNRDQNHLKLNTYDAENGEFIKTLFEESNDRYVEPQHPMTFLEKNKDQFIWFSERDGYDHMYLYNTNGELIKQLTKGKWVVNDLLGFDKSERHFFFEGNKNHPLQRNVYSVDMRKNNVKRLSPDDGTHNAIFNENGKYFIDVYSSFEESRVYQVISHKGAVEQILLKSGDPLADYNLGEMSVFTIKNNEGTDLYCRLIKPADFDPSKKYPVIVYVYGGPHSQLVTNSWLGGGQLFLYYLAQQGYVVFTLDNRGTSNRGFDFESSIHRNLGTLEVKDQMEGIEYLKSLPFVDSARIGVDGWSYGGFMTISMILKHPDDFKAAVAGGPVIDWKYYEVMYGERYMDTPEDNPEGYEKANLLNYVDQLQARLLILHGTSDPTVVWQNSLAFLKKSVEEGVQVDYFVYPGHPHNVRGKDRMHMYEKIVQYFEDFLK